MPFTSGIKTVLILVQSYCVSVYFGTGTYFKDVNLTSMLTSALDI